MQVTVHFFDRAKKATTRNSCSKIQCSRSEEILKVRKSKTVNDELCNLHTTKRINNLYSFYNTQKTFIYSFIYLSTYLSICSFIYLFIILFIFLFSDSSIRAYEHTFPKLKFREQRHLSFLEYFKSQPLPFYGRDDTN